MGRPRTPFLRKHLAAAALAVFPVLFISLPAFGQSRQAKERIARKACLDGDYAKGVGILSDLFLATMDSTYIFNQARCYEQNGRYESAIARFEEYLRSSLSPQNGASAKKHLEDCRRNLAKERESTFIAPPPAPLAPPPPVPTTPAPPPEPTPAPLAVASVNVTENAPAPEPPAERRWGLITGGIITATVGAGSMVAGLLFHMKANGMADDWANKPGSYSSSKKDTQETYRTLSGVGYGVGAAMVATGTVLIIVGAIPRTPSTTSLAIAPAVGPGLAGAVLTGAF